MSWSSFQNYIYLVIVLTLALFTKIGLGQQETFQIGNLTYDKKTLHAQFSLPKQKTLYQMAFSRHNDELAKSFERERWYDESQQFYSPTSVSKKRILILGSTQHLNRDQRTQHYAQRFLQARIDSFTKAALEQAKGSFAKKLQSFEQGLRALNDFSLVSNKPQPASQRETSSSTLSASHTESKPIQTDLKMGLNTFTGHCHLTLQYGIMSASIEHPQFISAITSNQQSLEHSLLNIHWSFEEWGMASSMNYQLGSDRLNLNVTKRLSSQLVSSLSSMQGLRPELEDSYYLSLAIEF